MTFEEAAKLDPDEHRGDIVNGAWIPMTKSTWRHGVILARITVLLGIYLRTRPEFSLASADPGVKLSRDPDVLRGPDVAVVRVDRVPTGRGVEGWLDGAPDLAVEVVGAVLAGAAVLVARRPRSISPRARRRCGWLIPSRVRSR
jgi:Uma2 family endonuclease